MSTAWLIRGAAGEDRVGALEDPIPHPLRERIAIPRQQPRDVRGREQHVGVGPGRPELRSARADGGPDAGSADCEPRIHGRDLKAEHPPAAGPFGTSGKRAAG